MRLHLMLLAGLLLAHTLPAWAQKRAPGSKVTYNKSPCQAFIVKILFLEQRVPGNTACLYFGTWSGGAVKAAYYKNHIEIVRVNLSILVIKTAFVVIHTISLLIHQSIIMCNYLFY